MVMVPSSWIAFSEFTGWEICRAYLRDADFHEANRTVALQFPKLIAESRQSDACRLEDADDDLHEDALR